MSGIAGLLVRADRTTYFVPADRVGFVARVREVRGGRLVMPRGEIAIVDPAGTDPSRRAAAVAVRQGGGFVALAVDAVDLADPDAAARAVPMAALDALLDSAGESSRG